MKDEYKTFSASLRAFRLIFIRNKKGKPKMLPSELSKNYYVSVHPTRLTGG